VPKGRLYGENVFDQKAVMRLVGTVEADRNPAVITFNDPLRLQRGLLGDAADAYFQQLFGKLGQVLP
jgi:hypothetical protein